jgi:hypothetical protein
MKLSPFRRQDDRFASSLAVIGLFTIAGTNPRDKETEGYPSCRT